MCACSPVTGGCAGENLSLVHFIAPVRFSTPRRISISPTQNSMVSPTRAGMASPNNIIAAPTARIVSVWPRPHKIPMKAALAIERSRLTMVETAMTWSGSVAWRIPKKKPIARMANPLVMVLAASCRCVSRRNSSPATFAAYRRISANAPLALCRKEALLFAVAQDAHQFRGGMRQTRSAAGYQVHVAGQAQLPHLYFFHPTALNLPLHTHTRHDRYAHAHLHKALDAFDGGHFNGHIQRGAVSRKQLNDAAAKGRFDAVRDEVFFSKLGDVDFALLCKEMLWVYD